MVSIEWDLLGHFSPALSHLHRTTFACQAANLWWVKQQLWQAALSRLPHDEHFAIIGSFPVPACQFAGGAPLSALPAYRPLNPAARIVWCFFARICAAFLRRVRPFLRRETRRCAFCSAR